MNVFKSILVTGGAGFIWSHLIRRLLKYHPRTNVTNLDLLTYAGNFENLNDCDNALNYQFIKGDINEKILINDLFKKKTLWETDISLIFINFY